MIIYSNPVLTCIMICFSYFLTEIKLFTEINIGQNRKSTKINYFQSF